MPTTTADTQAYALRQLDALAEKLESKTAIGDLAKVVKDAEGSVQEWLVVLARCFQLQDAIAVLELDRVLTVPRRPGRPSTRPEGGTAGSA